MQPDDGGTVAQRGANRVGIRRSGTARLVPAVTRGDGITGIVDISITGRVGGGVNIPITGKTLDIPVTGDARRFRLRVGADGQRAKRSGDSSRAVFGVVRARVSESNHSRRRPRAIHRHARGEGGVLTLRGGSPQVRRPQHAPVRRTTRAPVVGSRVVVVFSAVVRRGRGGVVIALQGRCAMVPSAAKFLGELLEAERHGVDDDASHVVEILELEGELAATAADVQHRSPAQSLRAEGVDEKTAEVAALPPLPHAMVARHSRLLGRHVAAARARRSSVGGMREPATLAVQARPRAAPMAAHRSRGRIQNLRDGHDAGRTRRSAQCGRSAEATTERSNTTDYARPVADRHLRRRRQKRRETVRRQWARSSLVIVRAASPPGSATGHPITT